MSAPPPETDEVGLAFDLLLLGAILAILALLGALLLGVGIGIAIGAAIFT